MPVSALLIRIDMCFLICLDLGLNFLFYFYFIVFYFISFFFLGSPITLTSSIAITIMYSGGGSALRLNLGDKFYGAKERVRQSHLITP